MLNHLRHAWRDLRQRPGFSAAVIAVMALSIGACTAIFSVVDAVLLTRLPYVDADRLAIIWHARRDAAGVVGMSASDYTTYRDTTRAFEAVGALTTRGYNLSVGGESSRITCARVTASLFPMMAVNPLRGRWIDQTEDVEGGADVVILSHELWQTRFGGDEGLLGRPITLDRRQHLVIGVMPPFFVLPPDGVQGLSAADCWVPAAFSEAELTIPAFDIVVLAKLRQGITLEHASDDAERVAHRIWEAYPAAVREQVRLQARVVSLAEQVVMRSRRALMVFTGAVVLLLLIGCANVANLMLARCQVRRRDLLIRATLGATRSRLVRQTLAESILLAGCGSIGGILLASGLLRALVALSPGTVPRLSDARVDGGALLFAAICAVFAGLLSGVAPALSVGTPPLAEAMNSGARGSTVSLSGAKARANLVVLELAIAVVLLVGAGLLLHSFLRLSSVAPGFRPQNVLTFSVALPAAVYQRPGQVSTFVRTVLDQAHRHPAVVNAAVGTSLPIGPTEYTVLSREDAPPGTGFKPAAIQAVSSEYQSAFVIDVKRGRLFAPGDDDRGVPVALINETMARQHWPDAEAIGQRMQWLAGQRLLTVVGVVSDVQQAGLANPPLPTIYIPIGQAVQPMRNLSFAIRSNADPRSLGPDLRRIIAESDDGLAVFGIQRAEDMLARSVAPQRFNLFIVATLAGSALTIAGLGLYAVIAYLVSASSREFGIRMALGATRRRIVGLVLARGLAMALVGLVVGMSVAAAVGQIMSSLLFSIGPTDAVTFAAVGTLLLIVSIVAVIVPASRATRVDPVVSLRHE